MICPICNVDYQNLSLHLKAKHPEAGVSVGNTLSAVRSVDEDVWTKQKRQLERMNEVLLLQLQQQQLIKAMQSGNMPFTPAQSNETRTTLKEAIDLIKEIQGMNPQAAEYEESDPLMSGAMELFKAAAMQKMNIPPPPQIIEVKKPWEEEEIPPAPIEEKKDLK